MRFNSNNVKNIFLLFFTSTKMSKYIIRTLYNTIHVKTKTTWIRYVKTCLFRDRYIFVCIILDTYQ